MLHLDFLYSTSSLFAFAKVVLSCAINLAVSVTFSTPGKLKTEQIPCPFEATLNKQCK